MKPLQDHQGGGHRGYDDHRTCLFLKLQHKMNPIKKKSQADLFSWRSAIVHYMAIWSMATYGVMRPWRANPVRRAIYHDALSKGAMQKRVGLWKICRFFSEVSEMGPFFQSTPTRQLNELITVCSQ